MAKPAKEFTVELTFDPARKTWGMSHVIGQKQSHEPAKVLAVKDFPALQVPFGFEGNITFTITSPGINFAKNNPMLAAPISGSGAKPTSLDPQFKIISASGGTSLKVKDLNGVPGHPQQKYDGGDFKYTLNFEGAPSIDPIISNGGCCKPTGFISFISSPIGLAAIGLLVLLLLGATVARKRASLKSTDTGRA